ncbi:MAG: DNA adenine methylase [Spirochaetota bacterium]|nr:DNA adenine methylase [Spirochaetota bacterium]
MRQYNLFEDHSSQMQQIINVASIQQLSPFRYPGGKTWLIPTIYTWMQSLHCTPELFIEPFAGGGIVSLTAANENLARHIIMVEIDDEIASVWKTILYGDADWLINIIRSFDMTIENVNAVLAGDYSTDEEKALKTIIKNRTFHGGILAKGSGLTKYGENGKGITSRWYPDTLAKRINHIKQFKNKITFMQTDGMNVIRDNLNRNAVFFLDPPYTAGGKRAGNRLYNHHTLDHERLFSLCGRMDNFLMTYDISDEIEILAKRHNFETKEIPMKNTHNAEMKEYIISKNLEWA